MPRPRIVLVKYQEHRSCRTAVAQIAVAPDDLRQHLAPQPISLLGSDRPLVRSQGRFEVTLVKAVIRRHMVRRSLGSDSNNPLTWDFDLTPLCGLQNQMVGIVIQNLAFPCHFALSTIENGSEILCGHDRPETQDHHHGGSIRQQRRKPSAPVWTTAKTQIACHRTFTDPGVDVRRHRHVGHRFVWRV